MEFDWLKKWNMYSPQSIAVMDGETGRTWTYQQLFIQSLKMALSLQKNFQIKKGDRVAVLATNELEHLALFFACQRVGAILVPINYRLTLREVLHVVQDSQPRCLFFEKDFVQVAKDIKDQTTDLQVMMFTGPDSFTESVQDLSISFASPFAGDKMDACMIIYTSGTTGAPKGALISNQMLFWNSLNTTLRLNISQSDATVTFLPFFHTGGWNVLTTPFLHRGAKIILIKKFDPDLILSLSAQEKCTLLFGVPTTMEMLSSSPSFEKTDLSSIRYAIVGGEPMPIPLIEKWHQKRIPIRQGYGLTEFGPNVFSLNEQDAIRKKGSIGFPNFYIEAQVWNENSQEAAPHEVGELVLRGPSCMLGYWNNPEATAKTIQNGWLLTGDLVRKDDEGFFYVVGRKKDMYKSGGENVYPPEIEQVLRQMPGIKEVAVIGVPDEKWGEVGKAFIVKKQDTLTKSEILDYCQKNLAKFKIPKHFAFLDELPKGDSGKILKKNLAIISVDPA